MIYILDQNLAKSAQALDDKSLDKQIKDIAQVLCNVHWTFKWESKRFNVIAFFTEKGKNKTLDQWIGWALECKANYLYLVELGLACVFEWEHRHDEKFDNIGWRKQPINKHLKVLRWARDNVPDLPVKNEKISIPLQLTGTGGFGYFPRKVSYETTQFPLVIPKKYIVAKFDPKDFDKNGHDQSLTIQFYRNYYQDKLKQYFTKLQKQHQNHFNGFDGFNCNCEYPLKWTNREKPKWLEV